MKKFISVTLLLVALLFALSACSKSNDDTATKTETSSEKKVIKIGYLPITHAAPLFLQAEKQYADYEIELVKFGSWPELMDALNTGRIDGASVLAQLAMKAKEQGIDLKAVALGHRDGNVLVGAPDIKEVKDLKGKTFAIPNKFSSHNVLLKRMLEDAGLKYEDVEVVELPPAEMPAALSEGRIAGYVVAEPFGAISVSLGKGNVLAQSNELWADSICCLLVLRGAFIEENGELSKQVAKDYAAGGELAHAKDDHTKEVMGKYLNVKEDVLNLSLEWISYDQLNIDKDSYQVLADALVEMGLSEAPPSYEDFVDASLLN